MADFLYIELYINCLYIMYERILQVHTFILYSEKSILWVIINMEVK